MISAVLSSGLGNQLFIVFALIAHALDQNLEFRFEYHELASNDIVKRYTYWNSFLRYLKPYLVYERPPYPHYWHKHGLLFEYGPIPKHGDNQLYFGWYQSYKYFQHQQEKIYELIHLKEQQEEIKQEYSQFLNQPNETIALHFRLGDYIDCMRVPLHYYKEALANFTDKSYTVICFFEEDSKEQAQSYIQELKQSFPNLIFIEINHAIPDWKQMLLMSLCNHNIIANSTFSWWGAYFNQNPHKRIYYPLNTKNAYRLVDHYPPEWNKLDITIDGLLGPA